MAKFKVGDLVVCTKAFYPFRVGDYCYIHYTARLRYVGAIAVGENT